MTKYQRLKEAVINHPWVQSVEPHTHQGEAYLKIELLDECDSQDRDELIYKAEEIGSSTLIPSDRDTEFIFKYE